MNGYREKGSIDAASQAVAATTSGVVRRRSSASHDGVASVTGSGVPSASPTDTGSGGSDPSRTHCETATHFGGNTIMFTTSRRMRRLAGGVVWSAASALIAMGAPAVGHADPGPTAGPTMGCEVIHWGAFGNDRRKVCDGPLQPDGSWQRIRTVFTPERDTPVSCDSNPYHPENGSQCHGGYRPEALQSQEAYPVTPDTVLPDEPGWLPPYTYNVL